MHEIFGALCRLLAPVLAFTAEESWRHSVLGGSVHLQEFPPFEHRGHEASDQVAELLKLRGLVGQAIEHARQQKLIGNALEAAVVLYSNSDVTTKIGKEELEEFFILSDLTIRQTDEASASVTKTAYKKCARCWRHRPAVGTSKEHPDLCDRCESVVRTMTKSAMTNDEGMNQMTNDEVIATSNVIRALSLVRHSSFVIRHSTAPQHRQ